MITSLMSLALPAHHFYVSKTILNYLPDRGTIEITMRYFTDDLEKVASTFSSSDIKLNDQENSMVSHVIASYIEKHCVIALNGRPVASRWVGMETEADLTYCYLEISVSEPLRNLEISNDCLMEVFPEQQNIVDFSVQGTTQTALLVKGSCRHSFTR